MTLQAQKVSGTFEKRAPNEVFIKLILGQNQRLCFTIAFVEGNCQQDAFVILMKVAIADI